MVPSREKEKLEALKKQEVSLHSDFQKKQSLVFKISFLYLSLTLFNLLIFWIAIGSNQMGLIKEKARYASKALSMEVLFKLRKIIDSKEWPQHIRQPQNRQKATQFFLNSLRKNKNTSDLLLSKFKLVAMPSGKILFQYPNKPKHPKVSSQVLRSCNKAVKLKEQLNKLFYGSIPKIADYNIDLYIPITSNSIDNIVLASRISLASVKQEYNALVLLAIVMIAAMLLVQSLFAILIYRILILPIKRLSEGAAKISAGVLDLSIKEGRGSTELDLLINVFNRMSGSLKEKTEKLETTIDELERHNKIVQNELDMARVIQQSLMPVQSISDRLNMSVYYAPLEKVSGDYYDMFELNDGSVGILMSDASGHGIPAALVTMMAKVHFSGNAKRYDMPGDLLHKVNQKLSKDVTTSDYLTAFYLIIRPDMRVHYSNGSHQLCIIYRKESGQIEQLDSQGFFIGAIEDSPFPYESMETTVSAGDRIILFTDGIVEGNNAAGEEYSLNRFHKRIQEWSELPIEEFNKKIIQDIDHFAGQEPRRDDYTLITLEIKEEDELFAKKQQKALALFKERDFKHATPLFEELVASDPSSNNQFYLANCYFFEKKYKEALPLLENFIASNAENLPALLKLSICYEKTNRTDKAIEAYKKLLSLDNKQSAAYTQLITLYQKNGKQDQAFSTLQTALDQLPSDARLLKLKKSFENNSDASQ